MQPNEAEKSLHDLSFTRWADRLARRFPHVLDCPLANPAMIDP